MTTIRYATIAVQVAMVLVFLAFGNAASLSPDVGKALLEVFTLLVGLVLFSDYLSRLDGSDSADSERIYGDHVYGM